MTREQAERAVLEVLAAQAPTVYLDRLTIGSLIWRKNGGTLCASVIGSLRTRKLIKTAPSGAQRFAITEAGRLALALEDERGAA